MKLESLSARVSQLKTAATVYYQGMHQFDYVIPVDSQRRKKQEKEKTRNCVKRDAPTTQETRASSVEGCKVTSVNSVRK